MNILLVIADLGLGGAQQVVINLANELVRQGHTIYLYDVYPELRKQGMVKKLNDSVNLVSRNYNEQPKNLIERITNSVLYRTGIERSYLKKKRLDQHEENLKKIIKDVQIDAVNSHVYWADEFVLEKLRNLHKKWWVTLHGSYLELIGIENSKKKNIELKINNIFQKCSGVIYLAESEISQYNKFESFNSIKKFKIYNGIPIHNTLANSNKYNATKNKYFNILIASRALKEKGWIEAANAIIKLNEEGEKVNLFFAGDGPILDEIKSKFSGISCLIFMGYVENIQEVIKTVDCILLPSYFTGEAYPTILLEGIAFAKPLIATNIGEIKSIVNEPYKCGIVIETNLLENEIFRTIKYLKNKPELIEEFKFNALRSKEKLKIETMANNYLRVFRRVYESTDN